MADRNEVFRIILEGRDRLSKELDSVRQAADKLDQSLNKLKRQKPDEFPLFGGGKASRGSGGQFIKKEEIAALDKVRQKIDDINRSINVLKRNRLKEGEFALFGGGKAVRGEDGRFIRVQDVTLLEKAKNRLDAIDKALVRIRTRARRGPLVEGEEAGAGATRLVRNTAGQFTRAQDLTFVRRLQREFSALAKTINVIQADTRQGIFLGARRTIDELRRVSAFADSVQKRIGEALTGSGRRTRTGVDPETGRFISVSSVNAFQKFVQIVQSGATKIQAANEKIGNSQKQAAKDVAGGFKTGFDISRDTKRIIDERVAGSREIAKQRKIELAEDQEHDKIKLSAIEDRARIRLFTKLEAQREEGRLTIEELRKERRRLRDNEEDEDRKDQIAFEIARIQRERRLRESAERAELGARFQRFRASQRITHASERREIDAPNIEEIEKKAIEERVRAISELDGSLKRMGARAGLAFGDIVRGAQSARKGLKDMDRDLRLVNNAFTRFGFALGSIFKNFGQLVNLRWLFLTGILSTFLTLLVSVGSALVAVAASAVQAGAALGGAFLSGLAQALPVVALLAAALSSFNKVLDQVKLNEKLDAKVTDNVDAVRDAGQRLADSQYTLKKALESVADAQFGVVDANKDLKDSYKDVRIATQDLADAKIEAARNIVDANLEERDAALSLAEAELGVLEAKKRLREEQKKAKGDTDVEGARAALREAQERLKIANQQADASEQSSAQHQVELAEQNLSAVLDAVESSKTDLKDAELGVKRAVLTVEQARVRNSRAQKDAKKARDEGIQGSDVVKSAQEQLKQALEGVADSQRSVLLANRNVRDSLHAVAIAQREVAEARKEETDARKGQTQADKDAAAAFADLAPAEKKLFNSLKRLRKVFKDVFVGSSEKDGILGPITTALARFADTLTKLLLDPQIQKAAKTLASAIADALHSFREFVASAEFKEALLFFTEKAADNIPRIVEGMLNLAQAFLDIAKAANPIFDRILEKAVGLTGRAKAFTGGGATRRPEEGAAGRAGSNASTIKESGLDKFLEGASKHLDAWLRLSGAIIGLIAAISGSAAAGSGQTLIGKLTEQLNNFTDYIKQNPEAVQKFFDDVVQSVTNLAKILGRLGKALVVAFSSDEFIAFAEVMSEIVIPGLVGLIFFLGKLSQALLFILEIPVVGDIVKFALAFLVFEKGLNKLFPVTQKVTEGIKKLAGVAFRTARVLLAPGGLRAVLDAVSFQARKLGTQLKTAGDNILQFGKRAATATASGISRAKDAIIAMGNAALGAAKKIGVVLWTSLSRLATLIGGALLKAIKLLRISVRSLLLSSGIGALILAGVLLYENWDKVKKYAKILGDFLLKTFKRVVDWVKENWKKILIGALLAPFLPAGLLLLGLYKFRDRIIGVFKVIGSAIKNAFKGAFDWIREQFTAIVDWMKKQYDKLPGPVKTIIRGAGKVASVAGKAAGAVAGAVGKLPFATGGQVPGTGTLDSVPALLTPGEWVLNQAQQERLSKIFGMPIQQLKANIFGTNSKVPPGQARMRRDNPMGKLPPGQARMARGNRKVIPYSDFNLVAQEDPDGVTVWFLELANGSFGQVTARDATKIQNSHGTWIPNYVKRSAGGFKQSIKGISVAQGFSMGGIISSPAVQRFARGGTVQAPGYGGKSKGGNSITQNFDVKTQGETDWGYVMRLGAIHAQESF